MGEAEKLAVVVTATQTIKKWFHLKGSVAVILSAFISAGVVALDQANERDFNPLTFAWKTIRVFSEANGTYLFTEQIAEKVGNRRRRNK